MKLRTIKNHEECESSQFNIRSLNEIVVYYEDGDSDSAPTSNFDVFLESNQMWKYMPYAFGDRDLIADEFNTRFHEPMNDEERKQGYY
jgi:hypothetical protein